jgi:hypothetical protein
MINNKDNRWHIGYPRSTTYTTFLNNMINCVINELTKEVDLGPSGVFITNPDPLPGVLYLVKWVTFSSRGRGTRSFRLIRACILA